MDEQVLQILSEVSGVPAESLSPETRLLGDLGLSSFDLADTVVMVEETYGVHIPDERFRELETVADILRVVREANAP